MTRKQYGWLIATLVGCTLLLAWVMWPAPNLDGLTAYEKCDYSYASTHGGTVSECRDLVVNAARARLNGGVQEIDQNLVMTVPPPPELPDLHSVP